VTNSDERFELCHINYRKITHHNVKAFQFLYCSAGSYFSNIHNWYCSQSSFINGCSSDAYLQLINSSYVQSMVSENACYNAWKI
jgi:hypothetical protein